MSRFIIARLLWTIPVVLGVSLIVFGIMKMVPGDVAQVIAGTEGTAEDVELIRRSLGLDRPVYEQYLIFLGNSLRGDFGRSAVTKRPVVEEIGSRVWPTAELAIAALLIALVVGLATGIVSATRQYTIWDNLATLAALIGVSMPVFWLGLMLMLLFGVILGWLPVSGMGQGELKHLILPAVTLASVVTGIIARVTRSAMLNVVQQDYILTARAKGLPARLVLLRHALRNALIPVITILGPAAADLITGSIIIETIFNAPGLGREFVDSIGKRDYSMIMGTAIFYAALIAFANVFVDLSYGFIDPRIRVRR